MKRKILLTAKLWMMIVVCFGSLLFFSSKAYAAWDLVAESGEGWEYSADGVLTLYTNAGWKNYNKGLRANDEAFTYMDITDRVKKLVIGKDVTEFSFYFDGFVNDVYSLEAFWLIIGSGGLLEDIYFTIYQEPHVLPNEIEVQNGNRVFRLVDGLLINDKTHTVVLSERTDSHVDIPDGITTIATWAFYQRTMSTITIPTSLKTIETAAFIYSDLSGITLPSSMSKLNAGAFYDCQNLLSITLPDTLRSIEPYTFRGCGLQEFTVPDNVKTIGFSSFGWCQKLAQINLPQGLERIDHFAFEECSQLQNIVFPDSLTYIGTNAFAGCDAMHTIILPESLREIGADAFYSEHITYLQIPQNLTDSEVSARERGIYNETDEDFSSRSLGTSAVDAVLFTGKGYHFGYPVIENANEVFFQGVPPKDADRFLDSATTQIIYCADEYLEEWESTFGDSWIAAKLRHIPLSQMNQFSITEVNATPTPSPTAAPTPRQTNAPTPKPTASPAPTATPLPEQTRGAGIDPVAIALLSVIVLAAAAVVFMALRRHAKGKK